MDARAQLIANAILTAKFHAAARRPVIGPRVVELRLHGQMFRARANGAFWSVLLPARPGVRPMAMICCMSTN